MTSSSDAEDGNDGACEVCGECKATTSVADGNEVCANCATMFGSTRADSGSGGSNPRSDGDTNDTPHPHERVADRLREAGLDTERFINVHDGEKATTDHTRRGPGGVTGNYGIYAGGGLVDVDVDDYADNVDTNALAEVNDLSETLAVETPHTSPDSPGHRFYKVVPGEEFETAADACEAIAGATNPTPSWGEIRVHNQYVVGPGSQLDGCDKEWCDECASNEGGRYRIAADRPIATITADDLADVLRADPQYQSSDGHVDEYTNARANVDTPGSRTDADDPTRTRADTADVVVDEDHPDPEAVVAATGVAEHYPRGPTGSWNEDDRSDHDYAICKEFARHGVPKADAERWFFEELPDSKVTERDSIDYGKSDSGTWTRAVEKVCEEDGTTGMRRVVSLPDRTGENRAALVSVTQPTDSDLAENELPLTPESVRAVAGLGEDDRIADLTDRQKAAYVWALVRQSSTAHVRVLRDNNALWAYDNDSGVWTNEGERTLRHAGRAALGPSNYGKNVLTELTTQAQADLTVETTADTFGLDPGQVAVENGLLDIHAAAEGDGLDVLRDLRPDDYALVRLPVTFDPDAGYDEWTALVEEWAEDGRADALQEYVGYCLHVGALPIHRALLLVGSGNNGKGTFLHVVRALLGDENTTSIELQTLANERDAVADFYGSVANIDDDLSARKLGAGLGMFKKLVAGDPVRGRHLYEDGFEFTPTGKHLYAANEVPDVNVPDDDEAFWRRWLLVEFPNHYSIGSDDREEGLKYRLANDEDFMAGVLNWAIEGHARLLEQCYFTNEERYAQAKRERWQAWGESADQFISECVERDPDAPRISTADAHRRYAAWCRERGERPIGQRQLTNKLKQEDVGYKKSLRINGRSPDRGYTALGFTDEVPPVEDTPERSDPPTETTGAEGSKQDSLF